MTENQEHKPEEQEVQNEYDIRNAAELLGVSTRTVRQRLIDGELKGYKRQSKYGPKWFIPESEIDIEKAVVEVVPLRKPITATEFKLAMKGALNAAIAERDQEMVEHISQIMDEKLEEKFSEIKGELEQARKLAEDRDQKLVELMRSRLNQEEGVSLFGRIKSFLSFKNDSNAVSK